MTTTPSPPPVTDMMWSKVASLESAPEVPSTLPSGSNPVMPAIPNQEAMGDARQLAKEVLMDILTGILLQKGPGEGSKGELGATRRRRKRREISVEEQVRAEERHRNLRSKKGGGE